MSTFHKEDALRRAKAHTEELLYHVSIEVDLVPSFTRLWYLCDKETTGTYNRRFGILR